MIMIQIMILRRLMQAGHSWRPIPRKQILGCYLQLHLCYLAGFQRARSPMLILVKLQRQSFLETGKVECIWCIKKFSVIAATSGASRRTTLQIITTSIFYNNKYLQYIIIIITSFFFFFASASSYHLIHHLIHHLMFV